jgi:prolyl-tRNA synthetase
LARRPHRVLHKARSQRRGWQVLDLYQRVFEDLLAIPVIPGVKCEREKFVGSLYTTTVEGFIPTSGHGIQGTTLPRTELFAEDPNDPSGGKTFVWQNSWGLATRTIGVKVMVHGDNKGLVLLPPMASVQVVIVWHAELCGITAKMTDEGRAVINNACEEPAKTLKKVGVRTKADLWEGYTPGYKFNDWKRKVCCWRTILTWMSGRSPSA